MNIMNTVFLSACIYITKGSYDSSFIFPLSVVIIAKIVKAYKDFRVGCLEDVPGFCKRATLEEIVSKNYSLNPGRYVGADESNKLTLEEIQEETDI